MKEDPKQYCLNCFYCDNIISQPEVRGLMYLGFPRCFMFVHNKKMKYQTYEDFINGAIKINWLDPSEPRTKKEEEEVLTKLWKFSVIQEEEKERLDEERKKGIDEIDLSEFDFSRQFE